MRKVYCQMVGSKVHDSQTKWVRYYTNEDSAKPYETCGPYRDTTDAENSTEDRAKHGKWEIVWVS